VIVLEIVNVTINVVRSVSVSKISSRLQRAFHSM